MHYMCLKRTTHGLKWRTCGDDDRQHGSYQKDTRDLKVGARVNLKLLHISPNRRTLSEACGLSGDIPLLNYKTECNTTEQISLAEKCLSDL